MKTLEGTTILAIKQGENVVMAGDGQVTFGHTMLKGTAKKVRRIYNGKILAGFAGATADAFTLFERFEEKLKDFNGNLLRSAVELAKQWRTDKYLRRLEALLLIADQTTLLLITGNGDVVEPDENIAAIGSGGDYALASAKALVRNSKLSLKEIAMESMKIASSICIYTNENIIIEELNPKSVNSQK